MIKKNQDSLMKRVVHTPSPEIVSTSSDFPQNYFSAKRSLNMQLMTEALSINWTPLP